MPRSREQLMDHVLRAAARLLPDPAASARLASLPIPASATADRMTGWQFIPMPDFARDLVPAPYTGLLVPVYDDMPAQQWQQVDWWQAAHDMLHCRAERAWEAAHGPAHSYRFRLGDAVPDALFDHAWVNRMILFLRRWWAALHTADETASFGALPRPNIHLTHDVDAVKKTLAIRLKTLAFAGFNALRYMQPRLLLKGITRAMTPQNYDGFTEIRALEEARGWRSIWHVYGGGGGWWRSPLALLIDPGYDAASLRAQLQILHTAGHRIGLHPRFASWRDVKRIRREKDYLETVLGVKANECRQHWLRFSVTHTWAAQAEAGFAHDRTLGFNDRMGFRSAAALTYRDPASGMTVTPLVLMDSHLYDYARLDENARHEAIDRMLQELQETSGEASIVWHTHVFNPDYGWGEGYAYLLERMAALGFET
jgi:hypothetical protein